jgi:molecular chaperone GrpE
MSHSEKPNSDTSVEEVVDDSAENEPSADKEPSAGKQPSAGKKPPADKKPSARKKSSADKESAEKVVASEDVEEEQEPSAEVELAPTDEELMSQLEQANEKLVSFRDQALRAQAEMQNVRKRAQRDVENAHKYGLEQFLTSLLPVIDSLEKAIEFASQAEDGSQAVVEGVELCLKMMLDILAKEKVEQIFPEGEPFDPKFHEAMSVMENPDVEPNTVLNVFLKGYTLNGRLVRPAMVIVSKTGE